MRSSWYCSRINVVLNCHNFGLRVLYVSVTFHKSMTTSFLVRLTFIFMMDTPS